MADTAFGFGAPAMRATTPGAGPQQVGAGGGTMSGLAPWLKQGGPTQPPFEFKMPQMGGGQQAILAQQRALAEQLRSAPVKSFDEWRNPSGKMGALPAYAPHPSIPAGGFAPPTQEGVPGSSPDALNPDYQDATYGGHMDYTTGDVPQFVQGPTNPTDPYGFGPDYSDFYNRAHGAGSYDAEATRYAGLDKSNELGSYEDLYGEFPESDPAAMEEWFRRAGTGGTYTAGEQSRISQNKRTDMTEAGIMAAVSAGMGALTGPASAASMAGAAEEAAALGIGNAYAGASGAGAGAAGSGLFSLPSWMTQPSPWNVASTGVQGAYSNPYGDAGY